MGNIQCINGGWRGDSAGMDIMHTQAGVPVKGAKRMKGVKHMKGAKHMEGPQNGHSIPMEASYQQDNTIQPTPDTQTAAATANASPGHVPCCGSPRQESPHPGSPWDLHNNGAAWPPNEDARDRTGLALMLHTAPKSAELDLIMRTLRRVFDAPFTCLALYYERSCWLTNAIGWDEGGSPWKMSACPWNCLVNQPQSIVAGELQEDARYHHQPWVTGGLRCYVSAPLLASNGHRLGTICFMDTVPRRVDAGMCRVLNNFGEISVRILERQVKLAARLIAANQQVPKSLSNLVQAAETGRDVRELGPEGRLLQGLDEGLWMEDSAGEPIQEEQEEQRPPSAGQMKGGGKKGSVAGKPPAKPPLPADTLLTSVFNRQLRSIEAVQDACCLVVDTGKPGWPVIYADETWKLWSGFPFDQLLGNKLQDFLAPATPGVAPLNWAALQREVDAGERFVVPGVIATTVHSQSARMSAHSLAETHSQIVRKTGTHNHLDQWQSTSMAHDLDMTPTTKHTNKPVPSRPASKPLSVDAKASSGTGLPASTAPAPRHTEDLFQAVAVHETGRQFLLGASQSSRTQGVELWHESSAGLHVKSGTVYSTPGASSSNLCSAARNLPSSSSMILHDHGKVFDLSFRPMALDVLDADALPLGIPSWVPLEACAPMLRLYAVRLHATTAAPMPPQPLTPAVKVINRKTSSLDQLAGHLFPGLGMGQVLGRGGYGTAYTGTWHDVAVVVKVQDYMLENAEALRTAQLEVALGQMLRHPYLVRTLAHGAAEVAPMPPDAASDTASHATPTPTETSRAEQHSSGDGAMGFIPMHSGFSPLSRWLAASEADWDDFGDGSWFSHCTSDKLVHRSVLGSQGAAGAIRAQLPSPTQFINAVAVAADAVAFGAAESPESPEARQPVQRQLTAQLLAKLQDGLAAATAPPSPPANSPAAHATGAAVSSNTAGVSYVPVYGAPAIQPAPNRGHDTGRQSRNGAMPHPANAAKGLHDSVGSGADNMPKIDSAASGSTVQLEAALYGGVHAKVGPTYAGTVSSCNSNISSSVGPSNQSVTHEMAAMMASGQQHASRMGAKPMQFPMHLRTFAILEYCDGGTLQDAIDHGHLRKGSCHIDSPPDMLKIVKLAGNIACAAAYLHDRGVVHADLSAANVLLCSSKPMVTNGADARLTADTAAERKGGEAAGQHDSTQPEPTSYDPVTEAEARLYTLPTKRYSLAAPTARKAEELQFIAKISDFGKSCLLGPEGVIKAGGYATVTHMAPEVLTEYLISPAADVYALGVLMWQMYTGSRPWPGMWHRQIIATVVSGEIQLEWPFGMVESLPLAEQLAAGRLRTLGRACLSYAAADRPTMAAIENELASLAQQLQTNDVEPGAEGYMQGVPN